MENHHVELHCIITWYEPIFQLFQEGKTVNLNSIHLNLKARATV